MRAAKTEAVKIVVMAGVAMEFVKTVVTAAMAAVMTDVVGAVVMETQRDVACVQDVITKMVIIDVASAAAITVYSVGEEGQGR